jgi:hypothetical protein
MFFSSPITMVTVFIVSHFSQLAPKSVIFQNAWGARKFSSPHFLHVYYPSHVTFFKDCELDLYAICILYIENTSIDLKCREG